jgi:hypothetical protein
MGKYTDQAVHRRLKVTTLQESPEKLGTWIETSIVSTTVPLDAALDLPLGPGRRLIIEEHYKPETPHKACHGPRESSRRYYY